MEMKRERRGLGRRGEVLHMYSELLEWKEKLFTQRAHHHHC